MNRSTNFNFYLPGNSDYRDVSQLNWNFEQIDSNLHSRDVSTSTELTAYDNRVTWETSDKAMIVKCGRVCTVTGFIQFQMTPTSSQTSIIVLPSGHIPSTNVYGTCIRNSDMKTFVLQASSSGNLNILNNGYISSGDRIYIGITYVI